jgi:uncharacterized membrane protein
MRHLRAQHLRVLGEGQYQEVQSHVVLSLSFHLPTDLRGPLAGLFILVELEAISYAFLVLGLSPRAAILALFVSLIGSYINIPLYTVPSNVISTTTTVNNFGILYQIPTQYAGSSTMVAINVGGSLIPVLNCAYALFRWPSALLPSVMGMAIVAYVAHQFAFPVEGVGIALPLFIPPLTAAVVALLIGKAMGARDRQPPRNRVRQWRTRHADRSLSNQPEQNLRT